MPLPNQIAPHAVREIRLIQTERLVLRSPRTEDAKTIAVLVNDRRIAENTLRIPHPYGIADAQHFITGATQAPARPYFSSSDAMPPCSVPAGLPSARQSRPSSVIGSPLHSGAMAMPPKRRVPSLVTPLPISGTSGCTPGRA